MLNLENLRILFLESIKPKGKIEAWKKKLYETIDIDDFYKINDEMSRYQIMIWISN